MAFESLTDDKIMELLRCPKRLTNPQARKTDKDGHEQTNYTVVATDDSGRQFEVYKRQNRREGMEDDFSCGIRWIAANGEGLTLKRYNGSSHPHTNHLEKAKLENACHIHIATQRYIEANRRPEGFAEIATRYNTIEGAFHCLIHDCHISGISTMPDNIDQNRLF